MQVKLVGGPYDGKVLSILHGNSISLPKMQDLVDHSISADNGPIPYEDERYTMRALNHRDGKQFYVFAHTAMTDEQVEKAVFFG